MCAAAWAAASASSPPSLMRSINRGSACSTRSLPTDLMTCRRSVGSSSWSRSQRTFANSASRVPTSPRTSAAAERTSGGCSAWSKRTIFFVVVSCMRISNSRETGNAPANSSLKQQDQQQYHQDDADNHASADGEQHVVAAFERRRVVCRGDQLDVRRDQLLFLRGPRSLPASGRPRGRS